MSSEHCKPGRTWTKKMLVVGHSFPAVLEIGNEQVLLNDAHALFSLQVSIEAEAQSALRAKEGAGLTKSPAPEKPPFSNVPAYANFGAAICQCSRVQHVLRMALRMSRTRRIEIGMQKATKSGV